MPATVHTIPGYAEAYSLGLSEVFENSLKQHKKTYTAWLREESISRWYDTDWAYSGLPPMPSKGMGENFQTGQILKGPTKQFTGAAYGLGIVIEHEAMKYELYGIFKDLGGMLAKSAAQRVMIVAYSLLNNSFSAPDSNYQTFQSENMISATHSRMDGGTWSNHLSSNPGLSYLAIQDMLINLRKLVDERGNYGIVDPKMLITGEENGFQARELLNSNTRPDQSNPGVINSIGALGVHTSPYITSTTAWWIECAKEDVRIKLRWFEKPNLRKDFDFRNLNLLQTMYQAFNVYVFDTRGIAGSTG